MSIKSGTGGISNREILICENSQVNVERFLGQPPKLAAKGLMG